MGFLDKAKKVAEQAQAKLDEAQQQLNSRQQSGEAAGPAVEYDQHGRPIGQPQEGATPPHGDPVAGSPAPPPVAAPPVPPARADAPVGQGDPLGAAAGAAPAPPEEAPAEDRNHPSYAPPKLSGGDPLAG